MEFKNVFSKKAIKILNKLNYTLSRTIFQIFYSSLYVIHKTKTACYKNIKWNKNQELEFEWSQCPQFICTQSSTNCKHRSLGDKKLLSGVRKVVKKRKIENGEETKRWGHLLATRRKVFLCLCCVATMGVPRNESARRNCGVKGEQGVVRGGWRWRATKRGNRVPLDSRGWIVTTLPLLS